MSEQNFDSLLDANLDDLADLPEFSDFPAGVHRCTINISQKAVNGKPAMEVKLTGIETVELSKPEEDKPINAGATSSSLFFMDNEFGQGAFKKLIAPLAASLGASSLREVVDQSSGMEVEAVTTFKHNKKNGQDYFTISKLIVG